jgi:hypothetical protein
MDFCWVRPTLAVRCVAGLALVMVAVPGCAGAEQRAETAATASAQAKVESVSHQCPSVVADRWMDVPTKGDDEPRLRIPQPAGWERSDDLDPEKGRLLLRNESLNDGDRVAVAVVNLVGARDNSEALEQVVSAGVDSLREDGSELINTTATLCGYPAAKITYSKAQPAADEGQPPAVAPRITGLISAANVSGRIWTTVVMLQAPNPDDPTFVADVKTILDGVQILPPAAQSGKGGKEKGR